MSKPKFKKRRPGDCEICGFRGCPACSEEELFRQMGIRDYECLEDPHIWVVLHDQIIGLKADAIALQTHPEKVAKDFGRRLNKIASVFEEICKRKLSD